MVADVHADEVHELCPMNTVGVGATVLKLRPEMVTELAPELAKFTEPVRNDTTGPSNVKISRNVPISAPLRTTTSCATRLPVTYAGKEHCTLLPELHCVVAHAFSEIEAVAVAIELKFMPEIVSEAPPVLGPFAAPLFRSASDVTVGASKVQALNMVPTIVDMLNTVAEVCETPDLVMH